jgi:predicted esterase
MTRVERRGPDPARARVTAILVHGRGASPEDILGIADEIGSSEIAYLAPAAPGGTWYPYSFLAPLAQNEPYLTAALDTLATLVAELEAAAIGSDRIALIGFSQGACLSLEYAARHARRYAAIIGFSGGLIGPPGTPRAYAGGFESTPVFLGCSDIDPHIPLERVTESAEVLGRMGAAVDTRIYPRMGHIINRDEIDAASALLRI